MEILILFNNNPVNRIILLNNDGTIDSNFSTGSGFNYQVNASCIDAEGNILLGGAFTSYNGQGKNRILRLSGTSTLSNSNVTLNNNFQINKHDEFIEIISKKYELKKISIFDITGKSLFVNEKINSTSLIIKNNFIKNQILIFNIEDSNGNINKVKFLN
ncbi:MAG: delta-60 repeat domain-containing protein [Flavobacterium sp.]|nr:delta-60 repeat domain-containing protein [Flavobacterium sp.]